MATRIFKAAPSLITNQIVYPNDFDGLSRNEGACREITFFDFTQGFFEEKELSDDLAINFICGYGSGARGLHP